MKRFELEQAIMDCWHVVDDIKTVCARSDRMSQDELMNVFKGIHTLYQMKFEDLFEQFEDYTSESLIQILGDKND